MHYTITYYYEGKAIETWGPYDSLQDCVDSIEDNLLDFVDEYRIEVIEVIPEPVPGDWRLN